MACASSDAPEVVPDGGVWGDDDGLLVHVGQPALAARGPEAAAALLERVRRHGIDAVRRDLAGHLGMVAVDSGMGRVQAAVDSTGMQPLFTLREDGVVAISDRQRLVDLAARGNPRPLLAPEAMADLLWQANLIGDAGAVRGARHLKADHWWEVRADGTDVLHPAAERPWDHPPPMEDAHWDQVAAALVGGTRELVRRVGRVAVSLTGGRDSRLVLGLALAAGVGDRITTFTVGDSDHPDVVAASRVAEVAGVPHTSRPGAVATDDVTAWAALEAHPWRLDASICPWDGLEVPAIASSVELSGLGGELYRVNAKRWMSLELTNDEDVLAALPDWQQPADPLGLLQGWVRERQDVRLREWAVGELADGLPYTDVEARLFHQNRLPLWSGIINNVRFEHLRAFPLCNPAAWPMAGRGQWAERSADVIHGEVLARVAPDLYRLPLTDEPWSAAVRANHPAPDEPLVLTASRQGPQGHAPFVRRQQEQLLDIVLSSPSSPLFDVVDRDALAHHATTGVPLRTVPEVKSLLSLVGMQVALTTGGRPVRDGAAAGTALQIRAPDPRSAAAVRASWPGEPDRPVLIQARATRAAARMARGELLRDVPLDALHQLLTGGGDDPFDLLLPSVTITCATAMATELRVDPRRDAGWAVVGPIVVEQAGRELARVDVSSLKVVNARVMRLSAGRTLLDCDDDPRLVLPGTGPGGGIGRVEGRGDAGDSMASLVVRFGLVTPDDVVAECFWDDGSGFAEARKARVEVDAHPLAAFLAVRAQRPTSKQGSDSARSQRADDDERSSG